MPSFDNNSRDISVLPQNAAHINALISNICVKFHKIMKILNHIKKKKKI